MKSSIVFLSFLSFIVACSSPKDKQLDFKEVSIYETNANGLNFASIPLLDKETTDVIIQFDPDSQFQKIYGFGGAMTESSAHLLQHLNPVLRKEILKDYFSSGGANYSLIRTHINSCDFSLQSYAYVTDSADHELHTFSIKKDQDDIIPMLKEAQSISKDSFKILASPWTAPPFMKDNNEWFGGKLMPQYYSRWAKYFVKYIEAYQDEGLPIWGLTVENEPMGNNSNWESMHYSPEEMAEFVKKHLSNSLKRAGLDPLLFVFDQNKGEELEKWSKILLNDSTLLAEIEGTAVHWYESTFKVYKESLQNTHDFAPNKSIIHSEACIDAEIPVWKDDNWYWTKNATDWGWDWAEEDKKKDHPKYSPVARYANDIIGCMNNWVSAWIDWNLVLDPMGGPNHVENWCIAPIIADTIKQEVYKTPLFYTISHFSRFVPPNSRRIAWKSSNDSLNLTAFQTPDKTIVLVMFNEGLNPKYYSVKGENKIVNAKISAQAIQTIVINNKEEY